MKSSPEYVLSSTICDNCNQHLNQIGEKSENLFRDCCKIANETAEIKRGIDKNISIIQQNVYSNSNDIQQIARDYATKRLTLEEFTTKFMLKMKGCIIENCNNDTINAELYLHDQEHQLVMQYTVDKKPPLRRAYSCFSFSI